MSPGRNALLAACTAQTTLATPLGRLLLARSSKGLTGAWFEGQKDDPVALDVPVAPDDLLLAEATRQLQLYFAGKLRHFDLPLDLHGTPFQCAVWRALLAIEPGALNSYRDIAVAVGRPKATRAVGAAVGLNPVSIIVPCHRVIGSNGTLTGYGGGLERKVALLRLEHREVDRDEDGEEDEKDVGADSAAQGPSAERTRSRVNGRSRSRTPVASATALASAAAAGPCAASPEPRNGMPGRSTMVTSIWSGTWGKRRIG
jgi:methylated-DNA-[protein]-cysteine S-methyltransferase